MKQNRLYSLLITALLLFTVSLSYAQEIVVQQLKLSNGLTIILNEDHTKTEVLGMVVVRAGAKNDPKDATGMAHYQEHMLFKGTTELGTTDWAKEKPHIDRIIELYDELGQIKDDSLRLKIQKEINLESIEAGKFTILNETSALVNQMGGTNLNAGTGWDQTAYYNAFPPNQIERWIELYSHRFMNPVFRAFQSELETVYEEKNMYQDSFFSVLFEAFNKNFYKNHPYGQQTIIGTTEHLKNPSLTKMYEFFNTYYVANNMAVVLVGDFDSKKIIPILKAKFGKWKSGEIPTAKVYEEKAFDGREQVTGKYSPIKLALLGFRSVPKGHKDEIALKIFKSLLSNYSQTGILNKLTLNGEIMAAEVIPFHNNDYGAELLLVVPRLIGQKLEKAENLVLNAVKKVRDGDFDEKLMEQAKKELYIDHQLDMENMNSKAYILADLFTQNRDFTEINSYPERIKAINKEEVIRVAKKYYGDNYLAFYSKMGSPKKEKLEKPKYDKIETKSGEESKFAKLFSNIKETAIAPHFVDFNKDITQKEISKGITLNYTTNPKNDIFTSTIKFKVGTEAIKEAGITAQLMNLAGTKDMSRDELKAEFAKIGCTYEIFADRENVEISLTGLEKDVEQAISLCGKLIDSPTISEKDLKTVYKEALAERKFEREDISGVARVLRQYVMYGEKIASLHRLSKKEIKKFDIEHFHAIVSEIFKYKADIHYVGNKSFEQVERIFTNNMSFNEKPIESTVPVQLEVKKYNENVVYFINRKKALQSNIYFLCNGDKFQQKEVPYQKAFNAYFGGGFSGLVLQEIREYRSLAYSAWANYISPDKKGLSNYFLGFVGTQADKTLDALKIFNDLKRDMPEKPERMSYIQPYLAQTCITSRPDFRDITYSIEDWKKLGYKSDPSILIAEKAKTISFDDITDFYQQKLKGKAMVTMIVGDKSKIDMEELSKYGQIKFIKEKELYTK